MGFIKLTTCGDTAIWLQVRYIIEMEQMEYSTIIYMRGLQGEMIRVKESVDDIIAMIGGMEE